MEYHKLNQSVNKNLILLFNGWAMNKSAVEHLDKDNFDVIEINSYTDFEFDFNKLNLEQYGKKYLICFSMGVYCANLFEKTLNNFDKKIAIAGTGKIIDNNFGIPDRVYNLTYKFLNKENLDKFIDNMFDTTNDEFKNKLKIKKTIDELKKELASIKNITFSNTIKFDKAIITKNDKIIPYKNQLNFWQNYKQNVYQDIEIIEINSSHYPFKPYKSFRDIIC